MGTSPNPSANTSQRNAIIIVVVLAAIVIIAILLSRGGNSPETAIATATAQSDGQPITPVIENDERDSFEGEGIILADFVAGTNIDRDGCVIDTTSTFDQEDTIYVGMGESDIPGDTPVFVRLYRNDVALEDTEEIEQSDDFRGCLWFQFDATETGGVLDTGSYEAEIFVDSRPADSISLEVR